MRKRIYIETTIPSFYHTLRTDPESVARMHLDAPMVEPFRRRISDF